MANKGEAGRGVETQIMVEDPENMTSNYLITVVRKITYLYTVRKRMKNHYRR